MPRTGMLFNLEILFNGETLTVIDTIIKTKHTVAVRIPYRNNGMSQAVQHSKKHRDYVPSQC